MTATVPNIATIEHLDFDPVIPCDALDCRNHPDSARPAVQLAVLTMSCCTSRTPICESCSRLAIVSKLTHHSVTCNLHHITVCMHQALSFEPLP